MLGKWIMPESRAQTAHPKDPVLAAWFSGGAQTAAGVSVTPDKAIKLTAVLACVKVLSETIASLPAHVYKQLPTGKEKARTHPLYSVIHDQPNSWQTSFEYHEMMVAHTALRGAAYAYKEYNNAGQIKELIPLHPDRTEPFWAPDGRVAYKYTTEADEQVVYLQDEIHVWRGLSLDGLNGVSVVTENKEAIGNALGAEEYGGRFFQNDATPPGVLTSDKSFKDAEARERFIKLWQEAQTGANRHKTPVLENGMTYQNIGVTNQDAQFLESRKFSVTEICRMFRVPPHMVFDLEKATFSNIENQDIGFGKHTIRPWLVRIEKAEKRDLFTETGKKTYFVGYVMDGLLRGDSTSRSQFYREMFNIGVFSQNQILELENMNPIEGGDEHYVPLNMVPISMVGQEPDELNARTIRAYSTLFQSGISKIVSCETKAIERAIEGTDTPQELESRIAEFYKDHDKFIIRSIEPVIRTLVDAFAQMDVFFPFTVDEFIDEFIKRHKERALSDIVTAITKERPTDELRAILEGWRSQLNTMVSNEITGLLNSLRA